MLVHTIMNRNVPHCTTLHRTWMPGASFLVKTPKNSHRPAPPLGVPFPENAADRASRRRDPPDPRFDLDSTYSLSFFSMFFDMLAWRLHVPGLAGLVDADANTVWRGLKPRIVMYDMPPGQSVLQCGARVDTCVVLCRLYASILLIR